MRPMTMQRTKRQQADVWNSALRAFDQWVDADEAQRALLLERFAADDPDTHASLLRLIAADSEAESAQFLNFGAMVDAVSGDPDAQPLRDLSGTGLGAWRIERLLGRGGSGQVWLAQRCDGRHSAPAAIKVLRGASGDRSSRLRFAREGRLLARLRHAHIARLLDVGDTAEGERYLVLEYVDGERIDRWCDQRCLGIEARLRLFLQVCDAVAYAHANLVVHRDLKPSNILVQDDGDAKVLDWGVAKLLDDGNAADDGDEVTRLGGAPFTPEYAAPEQFANAPVTVATDVYSLAMVLYVLLTGRRPYGDDANTPGDVAREVAADTPRRLSPRAAVHDALSEQLAQQRATTPQQLPRILRGDLDTIVEKALKADPAERYASVQSFGEDLRRYLEGKPIRARRDSRLYVLRKFVGRHRAGVATGVATLFLLLTVAAVVVLQSQRLKSEVARTTAIKNFFLDSYLNVDAYHASGEPADDAFTMLKGALRRIDKFAIDPQTRAETYETVADIFTHLGRSNDARESYQ
ncbi:MAG: serine/threonine protein kinase, partial [Gammaproteobacteria bacterium]